MARKKTRRERERDRRQAAQKPKKSPAAGWRGWARDFAIAGIILVIVLGGIYAYTQVWPPLVVVESSSMQHSDATSYVGVIDTGDLVFVQAAPTRADITTNLQGRATGYSTYGDYGDVIIFNVPPQLSQVPIIHRPIMYLVPNGTAADVPDLAGLPTSEWQGFQGSTPTEVPYGLTAVTIHNMGFNHDLGITFNLGYFVRRFGRAGYITMGDNNAYHACAPTRDPCSNPTPYDEQWFPSQGDIIGHARGEVPWFGLIKLLLSPSSSCCSGWGDPAAPANSWNSLAISLVLLISLPFIVEAAAWAWSKYAWPWLRPRLRRHPGEPKEVPGPGELADENPGTEADGPREGSSGP